MKHKIKYGIIFKYIFLILLTTIMLYPLVWMFLGSFKSNEEVFSLEHFLPSVWHFENYSQGWNAIPGFTFTTFSINSFIISGFF